MNKHFETHKATLVQPTEDLYIIDWRREDGRSEYYVRFMIDTRLSTVCIHGDLGSCISCWGNRNTIQSISKMMLNHEYWIEKFQCSSNDYFYDEKLAREELGEYYDNHHEDEEINDECDKEDIIEMALDEFSDKRGINAWDGCVQNALKKIFGDSWWELPPLGRKVHPRVCLWAEALDLALKQLNLK